MLDFGTANEDLLNDPFYLRNDTSQFFIYIYIDFFVSLIAYNSFFIYLSYQTTHIFVLPQPIMLDFGTDNEALLNDPFYRGYRQPRAKGETYYRLVDEFMQAVFSRYPGVLLQFEDFSSDKVLKHKHTQQTNTHCSFSRQ